MTKNNPRFFTLAAVAIAGIILWLLLRAQGDIRVPDTIINNVAGAEIVPANVNQYPLADFPPLSYTPATVNYVGGSKGCILCYSGYQRIETPAPIAPYVPPSAPQIYNYIAEMPMRNNGRVGGRA